MLSKTTPNYWFWMRQSCAVRCLSNQKFFSNRQAHGMITNIQTSRACTLCSFLKFRENQNFETIVDEIWLKTMNCDEILSSFVHFFQTHVKTKAYEYVMFQCMGQFSSFQPDDKQPRKSARFQA